MANQHTIFLLASWMLMLTCETTEKVDSSWKPIVNKLGQIAFRLEYTTLSNTVERVWRRIKENTHGCRMGWGDIEPADDYPCGIISPPTPPQGNLTWNISVHPLYHINVTIVNFNLTPSQEGCRVESLEILSSNGSHNDDMNPRCGSRLPWSVYIPGNEAQVRYMTEGGPRRGKFIILYQVYQLGAIKGTLTQTYTYDDDLDAQAYISDISLIHNNYQEYYGIRRSVLLIRQSFLHFIEATTTYKLGCYLILGNDGPFITSPKLPVAKVDNDTEHDTSSVTFRRSSGFIITFQVEMLDMISCTDETEIAIFYKKLRFPHYKIKVPGPSPEAFISDDCRYRNMRMCVFSTKSTKDHQWNITITNLELNGIDTSQHCLYEGVVLLPTLIHYRVSEYPIIICQKVRQYEDNDYFEDYMTHSIVNMFEGAIVVYYSYHIDAPLGKMSFTVSSTTATGVFAYCKKPNVGHGYIASGRVSQDSRLGAQLRPHGWGKTNGENIHSYGAHISRGYNGSLYLNVISVVDEAVIQYHPPNSSPKTLYRGNSTEQRIRT